MKRYFLTVKPSFMKIYLLFIALSMLTLSTKKTCSAQPPQWVAELANEVLTLEISTITHWEEKQMTWYNVSGQLDMSDSVSVNTLVLRGTTKSGHPFIGAIPITNGELTPVGERRIESQECSGECGCQRCEFKRDTLGCDCKDFVEQAGCTAWCKHSISSN